MYYRSLIKTLNNSYNIFNNNGFGNVDPNIVKYFRTEYGSDWQAALQNHLHKGNLKNVKKAA